MRILLIVPPSYRFINVPCRYFHLGLGYIAAVLKGAGHHAGIYEANIPFESPKTSARGTHADFARLGDAYRAGLKSNGHIVWNEIRTEIRAFRPELVGITTRIMDAGAAIRIAELVKEWKASCPVVMGGPGVTSSCAYFLQHDAIDYLVIGEGEMTMLELVDAVARGKSADGISGVAFRRQARDVVGKKRQLLSDLDKLPDPDRSALLHQEQIPVAQLQDIMGSVITSRGCPFQCTYCANRSVWGDGSVRERSVKRVVDEIKGIISVYGARNIVFWDDHLTTKRARVLDLCEHIAAEIPGLEWVAFARAGTIDSELLEKMKLAGCNEIQMGVESGAARVLSLVRKGVTLQAIENTARLFNSSSMRWLAFLMVGFPSETEAEMRQTIRLIRKLRPSSVLLSVVTPYPGTELHEELISRGVLTSAMCLDSDTYESRSFLVDTITPERFRGLVDGWRKYCDDYNDGRTLRQRVTFRKLRRSVGAIYRRARNAMWLESASGRGDEGA